MANQPRGPTRATPNLDYPLYANITLILKCTTYTFINTTHTVTLTLALTSPPRQAQPSPLLGGPASLAMLTSLTPSSAHLAASCWSQNVISLTLALIAGLLDMALGLALVLVLTVVVGLSSSPEALRLLLHVVGAAPLILEVLPATLPH